jgi:hypothetical protein
MQPGEQMKTIDELIEQQTYRVINLQNGHFPDSEISDRMAALASAIEGLRTLEEIARLRRKIQSEDSDLLLVKVAAYTQTVRLGDDREITKFGEVVGYWQTPEWLDGLMNLGAECAAKTQKQTHIS